MKVTVEIKAVPGDIVDVCNYRKSGTWERGEVRYTKISVNAQGGTHISYEVWIARVPKHPRGRCGYYVSVGGDKIIVKKLALQIK